MEAVLEIMEKTKRARAKDENIAALETENAILHLKIAQLQNSMKRLLLSKRWCLSETEDSAGCRKCDVVRDKALVLHTQIQLVRKQLNELQIHYSSLEQQIGNKLQNLRTIIPAILQQQTNQQINDLQAKYLRERYRRKAIHNTLVELRGNIRVHCRVRPVLDFDKGASECVKCIDDETVNVSHSHSSVLGKMPQNKIFEFDRVHPPSNSQSTVFSEVQPLIVSLLDGYNVCIMAYGQTGSGKTHTMLGRFSKRSNKKSYGVIPLAAQELFRLVEERGVDINVSVTVLEIYNEKINDLLSERPDDRVRHEVVSSRNGSMYATNLTKRPVLTSEELISAVHHGIQQRAVGSTKVHDHSSRSHLIVTVHLSQPPPSGSVSASTSYNSLDNTISPVQSRGSTPMVSPECSPPFSAQHTAGRCTSCYGSSQKICLSDGRRHCCPSDECGINVKLHFVDLAGSECVGASGVSGKSLKETKYINKSLSSLSDVLGALAEKRSHVPYRNSTLTHLLQDSIGGDAKMVMLLCVSPTVQYVGESLRVLGFGQRARQVQRRANCTRRR